MVERREPTGSHHIEIDRANRLQDVKENFKSIGAIAGRPNREHKGER